MPEETQKVYDTKVYADTLRSAVHAPETPREEDLNTGRRLVRNMLASFIIGSAVAGGVAYHYVTGWNPLNNFESDDASESATSKAKKAEQPKDSYQAPPKSTEESQSKEDPMPSESNENMQAQASDFEKCPNSFHLKMLMLNPSSNEWTPVKKRVTHLEPSQKKLTIAVKRINKGFKDIPLFYDGLKPKTTTVDEQDPSITYVVYDCRDKKIKHLLAQISINVGGSHYGPKSFNIKLCSP